MNGNTPSPSVRIAHFIWALVIVFVVFGLVEVLPLVAGRGDVPLGDVWPVLRARLPRMALVGLAVAALLLVLSPWLKKRMHGVH